MKKLLWMIIALVACEKEKTKPAHVEPPKMLFNWTTTGFRDTTHCVKYTNPYNGDHVNEFCDVLVVDSCEIRVNGALTWTNTFGYHRELKVGDIVDFYIVGQKTSDTCQLVFWQDKNSGYDPRVFTAVGNIIKARDTIRHVAGY